MAAQITLITGGTRSGKSRFAEQLTLSLCPKPFYIATAQAFDEEMTARISLHQQRREHEWVTMEEPLELAEVLRNSDHQGARLVDCLTLWLSNHMLAERPWREELDKLCACLKIQNSPVIMVTNEVGMGIVPASRLGREFRDAAGFVNQAVGDLAQKVVLVVAGQPLIIKDTSGS